MLLVRPLHISGGDGILANLVVLELQSLFIEFFNGFASLSNKYNYPDKVCD